MLMWIIPVYLDEAGLTDCIIVASNSLDEYTITSLNRQTGIRSG